LVSNSLQGDLVFHCNIGTTSYLIAKEGGDEPVTTRVSRIAEENGTFKWSMTLLECGPQACWLEDLKIYLMSINYVPKQLC